MYRTRAQNVDQLLPVLLPFIRLFALGALPSSRSYPFMASLYAGLWFTNGASDLTALGYTLDSGQALTKSTALGSHTAIDLVSPDPPPDSLARGAYFQWDFATKIRGSLFGADGFGVRTPSGTGTHSPAQVLDWRVNPNTSPRNTVLVFGRLIDLASAAAATAIDAHSFLGEKVSQSQTLAWPRTVAGSTTPPVDVMRAYDAELLARVKSLIFSGGIVDAAEMKTYGVSSSAWFSAVSWSYGYRVEESVGGASQSQAEDASRSVRSGATVRLRDRVSASAELDFQASPLLTSTAWNLLSPYFDVKRASSLYISLS